MCITKYGFFVDVNDDDYDSVCVYKRRCNSKKLWPLEEKRKKQQFVWNILKIINTKKNLSYFLMVSHNHVD